MNSANRSDDDPIQCDRPRSSHRRWGWLERLARLDETRIVWPVALAKGILLSLASCATPPTVDLGETPASFHDTRFQYALLIDDRRTLVTEFSRQTTPTIPERFAAALVLPVTAAAETAFWPVSASFRAYHERYCGDLTRWPRWVPCGDSMTVSPMRDGHDGPSGAQERTRADAMLLN
jgi:hypothetical protein